MVNKVVGVTDDDDDDDLEEDGLVGDVVGDFVDEGEVNLLVNEPSACMSNECNGAKTLCQKYKYTAAEIGLNGSASATENACSKTDYSTMNKNQQSQV